jgi:hypothetical protein
MELELTSPTKIQQFISIFQYLEGFSANVNLMFYSDRLYMQTTDAAKISVCELFLPEDWFQKYTTKNDLKPGKYFQLGINVALLTRVLKIINNKSLNMGGNTKLQMEYEKGTDVFSVSIYFNLCAFFDKKGGGNGKIKGGGGGGEETISLEIDGSGNENLSVSGMSAYVDTEKKQEYHFELPLIFISDERLRVPITMDYSVDFAISADWLTEIIKNLRIFGTEIEFHCSETSVSMSSKSEDQGMMRVPVSTDELHFFSIEEDLVLNMRFRTSFLFVISQFHKLSKWVYLHFMREQPMQIIYDLTPKKSVENRCTVGAVSVDASSVVAASEIGEEDGNIIPDARLVFYLAESLD